MYTMRLGVTLILLLIVSDLYGQTSKNADSIDLHKNKTTSFVGVHGDVGWNKSWFTSLGISYLSVTTSNSHGFAGIVLYAAGEIDFATYNNPTNIFYGYKGGAQFFSNGFITGIEIRGYTGFMGKEHTIFMPHGGLSILGVINLTYGYNVFQDQNNIFGIGHHQVAISVNLARKFFKQSFIPE